jgi:hypothetical protein
MFSGYVLAKTMKESTFEVRVKHCFSILIGIAFGPISLLAGILWSITGALIYYLSPDSPGYVNGRWTKFKEKFRSIMNITITSEKIKYKESDV